MSETSLPDERTTCPDDASLAGLLTGTSAAWVDGHVGGCTTCFGRFKDVARRAVAPRSGYRLVREIARGAVGRIVEAEDLALDRTVAIKQLLDGDDARRARFAREVLITARLQHPAIVPVYQAGELPGGEPYYAMRLVSGRSLAEALAGAPDVEQRLALLPNLIAVAEAVAYAHEQRVVHGELGTSDVLLGELGETVVIDWGRARDLSAADDGAGPAEPAEIVEGTDVGALGAMLHEVLAGRRAQAGRPVSLGEIQPGLAPELVAIVDKALDPDPARRYPSAAQLAADLRRFQTGQLVEAHRYTPWQLARRWVGHHRAAVGVAAAAALLVGVAAAAGLRGVLAERDRVQQERAAAEAVVDYMLSELGDRLDQLGRLELLDGVGREVAAYYQAVPADTTAALGRKAEAFAILGDVARAHGDLAGAVAHRSAALALYQRLRAAHPDGRRWLKQLVSTEGNLGDIAFDRGQLDEALAAYRRSLAYAEELARGDPGRPGPHREIAIARARLGDASRANGDLAAADIEYATALAVIEPLIARDPGQWQWRRDAALFHAKLGRVARDQGELAAAEREFRAALGLRAQLVAERPSDTRHHRDLMLGWQYLGDVERDRGDLAAAAASYRSALTATEQLVARDPSNAFWRRDLVVAHSKIGRNELMREQPDAALAAFRSGQAAARELLALDADNPVWLNDLAVLELGIADAERGRGDLRAARVAYQAGRDGFARLLERRPASSEWQHGLAAAQANLGELAEQEGDVAAALAAYQSVLALAEKWVARDPSNANDQALLAYGHGHIGVLEARRGETAAARAHLDQAIAILGRLAGAGRLIADQRSWVDEFAAARAALPAPPPPPQSP